MKPKRATLFLLTSQMGPKLAHPGGFLLEFALFFP